MENRYLPALFHLKTKVEEPLSKLINQMTPYNAVPRVPNDAHERYISEPWDSMISAVHFYNHKPHTNVLWFWSLPHSTIYSKARRIRGIMKDRLQNRLKNCAE